MAQVPKISQGMGNREQKNKKVWRQIQNAIKMTQEQYETIISIDKRLKELYRVQEEIKIKTEHGLTYTYKRHGEDHVCCSWVISAISDILDRHDLMIRQEIQDAIDQLKKQIEEL